MTSRKTAVFLVKYGLVPTAICYTLGLTIGISAAGCMSAKGKDTELRLEDFVAHSTATTQRTADSQDKSTATTQATQHTSAERHEQSRSTGGAGWFATHTIQLVINDDGVSASITDSRSATSQPSTVVIKSATVAADHQSAATQRSEATTRSSEAEKSQSDTTAHKKTHVVKAPTYSGPPADVKIDGNGITAKAIESRWSKRWPLFVTCLALGLIFLFLPLRFGGSPLTAVMCFVGAAASIILSDIAAYIVLFVAAVIALLPFIRKSWLLGRIIAQIEDWKSDMHPPERAAFDSAMKSAAGGAARLVDQLRVETKHAGGPSVVSQPVPEIGASV